MHKMLAMNNLRITSFNCNGALNKLPIISELCLISDVIFLQETWLMPHDLNVFDGLGEHFVSFSISAVDSGELLNGRPFGGLSILWRKSIDNMCSVINFDDARLLGLQISNGDRQLIAINVYLPFYSLENVDDYLFYVGKISSILENLETCDFFVLGDFNARVGGLFYESWVKVCEDYGAVLSDVALLPATTYTHVNHGSLAQSWLDHCLSSQTAHNAILELDVKYDFFGSDHLPLVLTMNYDALPNSVVYEEGRDKIKWDFSDQSDGDVFYEMVCSRLRDELGQIHLCQNSYCNDISHANVLDDVWKSFTELVVQSGEAVFGYARNAARIVPGWNSYVKDLYEESRHAFMIWRGANSPRSGQLAENMRRSRAIFKASLRRVKRHEQAMRAEAIASKLRSGNILSFWKDIKSIVGRKRSLPQNIDQIKGDRNIAELWRAKYSSILNSVDDQCEQNSVSTLLNDVFYSDPDLVSPEEICLCAGELANGKSSGIDGIPSEFFKYAPTLVFQFLSCFVNSVLSHGFVPRALTDIIVKPVIKSNLKDPTDSGNYRPIAIASSASKLIEKILYSRLDQYLTTSANQFGFKKGHSTDQCIYALKETINYYYSLNTPIFACFIDIKSAYDRISHGKLFLKMIARGVPRYLVLLVRYWYASQRLFVEWGDARSSSFSMKNGIRQGSLISPYLFNLYVDDLNKWLSEAKHGCYVGEKAMNNFSYADDLALLAPSAGSLNALLSICRKFADENMIEFSAPKSVVLLISPQLNRVPNKPNIYLGHNILSYVHEFKYLGHIISECFTDDKDIERERRALATRGNLLLHKFRFCSNDVKCLLFKTYCYQMYCCSLWSRYRNYSLNRIKVTYNNIMRRLMSLPPWCSASSML